MNFILLCYYRPIVSIFSYRPAHGQLPLLLGYPRLFSLKSPRGVYRSFILRQTHLGRHPSYRLFQLHFRSVTFGWGLVRPIVLQYLQGFAPSPELSCLGFFWAGYFILDLEQRGGEGERDEEGEPRLTPNHFFDQRLAVRSGGIYLTVATGLFLLGSN